MKPLEWSVYPPGQHRGVCPLCPPKGRREKSLSITILGNGHGIAHCHRCNANFRPERERDMSMAEFAKWKRQHEQLQREADAAKRKAQGEAARSAQAIWNAAEPAPSDHPYLQKKAVKANGLRIDMQGRLLAPARDEHGTLWSLQRIGGDGTKLWTPGSRTAGCYFAIGRLKAGRRLVICEGVATGFTLHEASGDAVAIAFSAGNLLPVAQALRKKYPNADMVVAADDDHCTPGNPGLTRATEAARAVDALLAVPDFTELPRGPKHTDFNDAAWLARETTTS